MKINIQSKVVSCRDISSSVKQYLCAKARNQPLSFLPFQVERVAVTPKKASLQEYKESFMAVVSRNNTAAIRYQKSSRRTERTHRTAHSSRKGPPLLNQHVHRDQTLIHSFYAQSLLGERRAQTAEFSQLRKRRNLRLSNLANQHDARESAMETADRQFRLTAGPKTQTRARKTLERLESMFEPLTHRTCLGAPPKRHSAVDSRATLNFSHNPATNLFEFSYYPKKTVAGSQPLE